MSLPLSPTPEDIQLVQDAYLLPLAIQQAQKNLQQLQEEKMSMRRLFEMATKHLIGQMMLEQARVKKEMFQRDVRLYDPRPGGAGYVYRCRAVTNQAEMTERQLQEEISAMIKRFVEHLSDQWGYKE